MVSEAQAAHRQLIHHHAAAVIIQILTQNLQQPAHIPQIGHLLQPVAENSFQKICILRHDRIIYLIPVILVRPVCKNGIHLRQGLFQIHRSSPA